MSCLGLGNITKFLKKTLFFSLSWEHTLWYSEFTPESFQVVFRGPYAGIGLKNGSAMCKAKP